MSYYYKNENAMRTILFASLATLSRASNSPTCDEGGTKTYTSFLGDTVLYAADTTRYGSNIGAQSDKCSLTVTPTDNTFSIWSYIYTQQAALLFPGALEEEEMYELSKVYKETGEWLRSFTQDQSNAVSVDTLDHMLCHLRRAVISSCETKPRVFACCAFAQYHTWLSIATALSKTIHYVYGDTCGTPHHTDAEAQTYFEVLVGGIVDHAPRVGEGPDAAVARAAFGEGPDGAAARAVSSVLAWAYRGVCDARNGDCIQPHASNTLLASLKTLSQQTDLTLLTSLTCA